MTSRSDVRTGPIGEPTRLFDPDEDRLRDHYPVDTRAPFDVLIEPGQRVPAHVESWLQDRYTHASAVNHRHWRDRHVASLATPGVAPGKRLARRRRVNWWSLLAGAAATVGILLSIVGTVAVLQRIAEL